MDPASARSSVTLVALDESTRDAVAHRQAIADARQRLRGDPQARPDIGRYRIERRLGAGGMGEVYLGHDDALARKVAIKLVLARLAGPREQLRLRDEARALAKLSHPNVVQVYEIGEHAQHTILVMEYIAGQTLASWLNAASPQPWPAVLARFLAAGRGLVAAHGAGVIHRDFKPENVLIGDDGRVCVADFGLALTAVAGHGGGEGEEEGRRAIVGTIRYMAPEQLLGEGVDPRADQFSFAIALYEALWQTQPYALGTIGQRIEALERGQPRPPDRSTAPRGLWRLLRPALARRPEDRWPDLAALLDALEDWPRRRRRRLQAAVAAPILAASLIGALAFDAHERRSIVAACEAEGQAITRSWNAEREATLAAAFAADDRPLAAVAWAHSRAYLQAYADDWQRLRTTACLEGHDLPEPHHPARHDPARHAPARPDPARPDPARHAPARQTARPAAIAACLDEAAVTFSTVLESLAKADRETITYATAVTAGLPPLSACREDAWLEHRANAGALTQPQVELRLRLARAKGLKLSGRLAEGLAEAEATFAVTERLGPTPVRVEAGLALGELRERNGDYSQARAQLYQTFVLATAIGHDFVALRAAIALTRVDGARLGDPVRGAEWGDLAQALLDRLELRGSLHEASALDAIANCRRAAGDPQGALATHRRALALDRALHGPEHPDVAVSLLSIANLLLTLEQTEPARATFEQALAIQDQTLGSDHPDRAHALVGLGRIALLRGDLDGARREFEAALAIEEAALGPTHPYLAFALEPLADVLQQQGEVAGAEALRARARRLRAPTPTPTPEGSTR